MQGNDLILQVDGLTKYFPIPGKLFERPAQLHAVENMSFNVYKGKTLGIVGESGSGKSTVARLILKLLPATSGRVLYEGKDILPLRERDSRFVRQQLQMIFQDPYASLDPRFKIGYTLEEPLKEHKIVPANRCTRWWATCWKKWASSARSSPVSRTSSPAASASASTSRARF